MATTVNFPDMVKEIYPNSKYIKQSDSMSDLILLQTPMWERKVTVKNDWITWSMFLLVWSINSTHNWLQEALNQVRAIKKQSQEYLLDKWLKENK